MGSTLENVTHYDHPENAGVIRHRRWLYRAVVGMLTLILGATVLDGLDVLEVVGPDEAVVRVSGDGWHLAVEHPSTIRPALAGVFRITVANDDGFDGPVQVGVSRHYLEMWDVNGTLPAPSGETASGDWIIWEFDVPPTDELTISYEARVEPGVQEDRDGEVGVFVDDELVLLAEVTTHVRP